MSRHNHRRVPMLGAVLLVLVLGGAGCAESGLGRAIPLAWGGAPGRMWGGAVLPTHRGGAEGTCARCQGVGVVPCLHCRGLGGRPSDGYHPPRPCEACFGRGLLTCPLCNGRGTLPGVLAVSRRTAHRAQPSFPGVAPGRVLRRAATAPRVAVPAPGSISGPPRAPDSPDDRPRDPSPDPEEPVPPTGCETA